MAPYTVTMPIPPPLPEGAAQPGPSDALRRFKGLVRHFQTQLLYGCTSPECKAQMCATGMRNLQKQRPFRPYTPLSAQILAHHLAAAPDPDRYLCANALKDAADCPSPVFRNAPVDPKSLSQAIFSRLSTKLSNPTPEPAHLPVSEAGREERLWTAFFKNWDGKPVVHKHSVAGVTLFELERVKKTRFLDKYLDPKYEVSNFIQRLSDPSPDVFHLYEHPWLFSAAYMVVCFRTANLGRMMTERKRRVIWNEQYVTLRKYVQDVPLDNLDRLWEEQTLLSVRREHILEDTFDQLRKLSRQSLRLPLKIELSGDMGEIGQDEGGVSCEFFHLVIREALRTDNMFSVNEHNTMWLQSGSTEPLWKFEMMGLVFSLALYNGITLPACPPSWFFSPVSSGGKRLLQSSRHDYIEHEQLGLLQFLRTKEGDEVEKQGIFYAYTMRLDPDTVKDVNLKAFFSQYSDKVDEWTKEEWTEVRERVRQRDLPFFEQGQDCPYVTAADRDAFILQYRLWVQLISVLPQHTAFSRGFLVCVSPPVFGLLSPRGLRALILGLEQINLKLLRQHTRYNSISDRDTVKLFWSVVADYSMDEKRLLLKFVTACERVPIGGYAALGFKIITVAGDIERLPTSSTCTRTLYLPHYPTEEMMREKLGLAIRWGEGFGLS